MNCGLAKLAIFKNLYHCNRHQNGPRQLANRAGREKKRISYRNGNFIYAEIFSYLPIQYITDFNCLRSGGANGDFGDSKFRLLQFCFSGIILGANDNGLYLGTLTLFIAFSRLPPPLSMDRGHTTIPILKASFGGGYSYRPSLHRVVTCGKWRQTFKTLSYRVINYDQISKGNFKYSCLILH